MLHIRAASFETEAHRTAYVEAGPTDGPLLIFVHGWPQLGIGWRHQLDCFSLLGFRCVAPDLRGSGGSTIYHDHEAYAQPLIVADMVALLRHLGRDRAIWIGHDWGAPVVWNIASHHPEMVDGVVGLSVPYRTVERGARAMLPLVDRSIYPEARFPYGQWEYQRFYHACFERATRVFEADLRATMIALHRRGNSAALGLPTSHADIFEKNGWFNGADRAPILERDDWILSEADLDALIEAFSRTGFFGADSFYMNDSTNLVYSDRALNGGKLDMPVLFIAGRYDMTCESIESRLAEPMRNHAARLSEAIVETGHWMHQEQAEQVNAIITRWLSEAVPAVWPTRFV